MLDYNPLHHPWPSDPYHHLCRGAHDHLPTVARVGRKDRRHPVDDQQVAEHLAAAVRCQTVPLDEQGTPDPEAFSQLHQMLEETYPLVHQKLKREVINGYSLLYIWQGSRADLEPVMLMAHQDVVSADPTEVDSPTF